MEKIGFIGLGRMGRPMASNLQRNGFQLSVLDIHPAGVETLVGLGATAATDIAELTRGCDIILTMLPSSVEVVAVVTGSGGILDHARAGQLVMDMSTIDPAVTRRIATALAERGVAMVHAPVGRLAIHADRGESLFMVGADPDDFARVRPLLDAMGTTCSMAGIERARLSEGK